MYYDVLTMSEPAKRIDVTSSPELRRLAEQVQASRTPVALTREDEVLAVVRPARARARKRIPSAADYEAFRSSFGGWKGIVDVKKFKAENRRQKLVSTRPPIEL
jgi:hypothetical protein